MARVDRPSRRASETLEHYKAHGYPVIGETLGPLRVAYVDTVKDFGFITELVEKSDGFLGNVARLAQTCAEWEGRAPVRLLTRDGYRVPEEV